MGKKRAIGGKGGRGEGREEGAFRP